MTRDLQERLLLAAVEALIEGDPVLTIAVGDGRLNITWRDDDH